MKACFTCSKNNFIRSFHYFKISLTYLKYAFICVFHKNTNNDMKHICTTLSTPKNNVYGCSCDIYTFNIRNTLPKTITTEIRDNTALLNEIHELRHAIKTQDSLPHIKVKKTKYIKWLDELFHYRTLL